MATGDVLDELLNHVPLDFVETGTDAGHAFLTSSVFLRMRSHMLEGGT